jgi:hypothetical protein
MGRGHGWGEVARAHVTGESHSISLALAPAVWHEGVHVRSAVPVAPVLTLSPAMNEVD